MQFWVTELFHALQLGYFLCTSTDENKAKNITFISTTKKILIRKEFREDNRFKEP